MSDPEEVKPTPTPTPTPSSSLLLGRMFGRYITRSVLAQGPRGAVYAGESLRGGERVVIKVIGATAGKDEHFAARFKEDLERAKAIEHKALPRILDFGEDDDSYYIVSELLTGEPLAAIIQRGRVGEGEGTRIAGAVADCMSVVHGRKLLHANLKPS